MVGRDGGRPSLHSHVPVLVRIVDSDMKVPEFLSKIYTLTVSEDTQPGGRKSSSYSGDGKWCYSSSNSSSYSDDGRCV